MTYKLMFLDTVCLYGIFFLTAEARKNEAKESTLAGEGLIYVVQFLAKLPYKVHNPHTISAKTK